jgi:hypothetical protein
LFAPVLEFTTTFLLGWLNYLPKIKLLTIMVLIPFIFNAIQFWIQDNILKADKKSNIEFISNARMTRSLTMKPKRNAPMFNHKSTKRSESLTSNNGAGMKL